MKKSSFRHYSLDQAKRRQLEVKQFGGVDYSTQKFLVADGRAIDIKNYLYKDGIVQKRHGWEQLLEIPSVSYFPANFDNPSQTSFDTYPVSNANDKEINGIWKFEAEDGQEHIVAHIGKLMYEIKNIDSKYITANLITFGVGNYQGMYSAQITYEFENFKSFAFVGGKKLWFLGGNKYMCLRFLSGGTISFFPVEDSNHTPIPTTSISITYANSIVNQRTSLDSVNLLTKWRKNKCISGTTKDEDEKTETTFYEYTLDAPIMCKTNADMVDFSVTIEERGEM